MITLPILRSKRPRDAYKLVDRAQRIAAHVTLQAIGMGEDKGRWYVQFRHVDGAQRSKVKKIPPFWDTDAANALIRWNKEQGGELPVIVYGSKFLTSSQEDAMMMRMAFA